MPLCRELEIPSLSLRTAPFFAVRGVHAAGGRELWRWMAFNGQNYRLQNPPGYYGAEEMRSMGVEPFFISHSFAHWIDRGTLAAHPEWNPLVQGRREPPPEDGNPHWVHRQLCLGNGELRRAMAERILAYLEAHPEMDTVALEPNDGDGYCECELCHAYGATISQQVFRWASEMAKAVQEKHPEVRCLILSYAAHEELPSFPMPDNLWFGVVVNNRNYGRPLSAPENQVFRERLERWAATFPRRVYLYELWLKEYFQGWISPYESIFTQDMKLYRDLGLAGIEPEGIHPSPAVECLRHALSWNPDADPGEILEEMCRRLYGPGGGAMFRFYRLLDERNSQLGITLQSMSAFSLFTQPVAREGERLLQEAWEKTREFPKARRRIHAERENFARAVACGKSWRPGEARPWDDTLRRKNRLKNGGFEEGLQGVVCSTMTGRFSYGIVPDAWEGKQAGEIRVREPGWGRMILETDSLDPSRKYAVEVMVKTVDGADMSQFWLQAEGCPAILYRLGDTGGEWWRLTLREVEVPKGRLSLFMTINTAPDRGAVRYDDLIVVPEEEYPLAP
ncbi:MAG: DUF4838 domain-containing protein [Oligosphaeraceae bacterium]